MNREALVEFIADLKGSLAERLAECTTDEERTETLDLCEQFAAELVKVVAEVRRADRTSLLDRLTR